MDAGTCLELALEGERLCKAGDCRAGVAFFEAAIQTGTDDLRTLSAIYSQLGNAYFYLGDYDKAMDYHKLDLTVAKTMGDRLGVAKASGNLGNTLKVMGKFKEAILCCERHLLISQELGDKVGEGRALYNLGNVYHAQGKHLGRVGPQEPGGFSDEVKHCLQKAVEYYAGNLALMAQLKDRSAEGRACGNLGNTHYLLGNFAQAITYHSERLNIAREFGDKAAERRAHSNLGNAHIFLGEFETAADHYKKTLALAQELCDRAVEAQACYSLGNTYTLLRDYPCAIHYHLRHLAIAQELCDRVGEGRACWSLGNAYSATGNNQKALHYATRHLAISREIGDKTGEAAAEMNLTDIRRSLGLPLDSDFLLQEFDGGTPDLSSVRRKSMEKMDLLKMTPDFGDDRVGVVFTGTPASSRQRCTPNRTRLASVPSHDLNGSVNDEGNNVDEDSFFELLTRFQSTRMDDQRCTLAGEGAPQPRPLPENDDGAPVLNGAVVGAPERVVGRGEQQPEELLELIVGMQSRRMDEQRATLPNFDMLIRCQSSRLEDQRSTLPNEDVGDGNVAALLPPAAPTVPDDDFFTLIMRFQAAGRLEDQRSALPTCNNNNNSSPNANNIVGDDGGNELVSAMEVLQSLGESVQENGDASAADRNSLLSRGSNASSTGVVVPTGGLTKAILDRIRITSKSNSLDIGHASSSSNSASVDKEDEGASAPDGMANGTKEKLINRLVKSRK
ncbi:G-protein-signaling modulator 2 [Hyalella azteca]|uniref:G-protein-signaling modulator 2 n=1 Tax=Hyalella azteca TaxID=294128 RepID=A0A8B7PGS0_HYAAZ|nr:G-protein-signaling modulator 2 [Hyalella azteca]